MIDSHCHLADHTFEADLDAVRDLLGDEAPDLDSLEDRRGDARQARHGQGVEPEEAAAGDAGLADMVRLTTLRTRWQ